MPRITFIEHNGTARTVEGEVGSTVMETAIRNAVPGIEAECGGACACATCHVYVGDEWLATVGKPARWKRTCSTSPSMCGRVRASPADQDQRCDGWPDGHHACAAGLRPSSPPRDLPVTLFCREEGARMMMRGRD